jgi:hypothetical protein
MGAAKPLIAISALVLALVVPWVALLHPGHLLVQTGLAAALFAAACHGWGRVCGVAVRRRFSVVLTITVGLAALIAFGGVAMMFSLAIQLPLLVVGTVAHSAFIVIEQRSLRSKLVDLLVAERFRDWAIPIALLLVIGAVQLLGSAAASDSPFDDDGHVFAQVRRLLDTGTLGDAVGYARVTQFGGNPWVRSLAASLGDLTFARVIDPLGFILALLLVCSSIKTGLLRSVAVLSLGLISIVSTDASLLWVPISITLALHQLQSDVADARTAALASMVGGALVALRLEWLPVACIMCLAGWRPRVEARERGLRFGALVVAFVVTFAPYAVVRHSARIAAGHAAVQEIAGRSNMLPSAVLALALLGIALPLTRLLVCDFENRSTRWSIAAAVVGITCIAAKLTATAPYTAKYAWPILVFAVLLIAIETVRRSAERVTAGVMVVLTLALVLTYEARSTRGPMRLALRYDNLFTNIVYLRTAYRTEHSDVDYARLLQLVPAGQRVVIWVERPERIDYSRVTMFDVRVPRISARRQRPWQSEKKDAAVRMLRALRPRYLMIEDDGARQRYAAENFIARAICAELGPCPDPLERLLAQKHIVASSGATSLYELRW